MVWSFSTMKRPKAPPSIRPSLAKAHVLASNERQHREDAIKLRGGCYGGAVRYEAEGEPMMKAQCHCRECQYITGGSPNMFVLMPIGGFVYAKGGPKQFSRSEL